MRGSHDRWLAALRGERPGAPQTSVPIRLQPQRAGSALVVQMAGVGCGYVMHVALARWMGPSEYGRYSYVMAWIGLVAILAALGLPVTSVRFISQYRAAGQTALLHGTVRRFRSLVVTAGSAIAIVGTLATLAVPGAPWWFAIAWWIVPLASFVNLNTEMARGLERPGLSQVPDKVVRPLALIAGGAMLYHANGKLSVAGALTAGLLALVAIAALQLTLMSRAVPPLAENSPRYRVNEWMSVAASLLVASSLVMLLNQVDLLVAGLLLDAREIGIYSAALRIATLVGFVPLSIMIVASPQIAALHSQNDRGGLQLLASRIAYLSFWPSLLLASAVVLFALPILRLFGSGFEAARWPLCLLVLSQLFKSAMGAVGYFLDMTGHQTHNARACAAASFGALIMGVFLIPRYGILGAACTNLLSWAFVTLWLHRQVSRYVGVRASILSTFRSYQEPGAVLR